LVDQTGGAAAENNWYNAPFESEHPGERDHTERERRRRLIVALTVAFDLGILGVFKYYSFFAEAFARALHSLSLGIPFPLLTVALPVGISFFGRLYSEPMLIKLAYAYEQATKHRRAPQFIPTLGDAG